ncbi:D-3-phosphoglycerate dehydrogenase [Aquisphaera giovannonii]|uniref:D-3-phosphoglycerate dehydrogenase n=1 Tax=Aquisphaera giovannonii TaxID=406548 RepID=A0A5B9W954_9BACT|nr:hydroxyacid dehydrogenase [Aquisphaera giovannonii]QEH36410.1 D-3-phosphoglycerate dehydrogenase [Aquisphaera giovannonii]
MSSPSGPLILLIHPMKEAGLRLLREAGDVRMATGNDPGTIGREVRGAQAVIIRTGGKIDAAVLDAAGKGLKVVGRHGVGYDQIDVAAATSRGVQVVYTPGANTQSVAEHVFAMFIGLSKHFPRMTSELAKGNYDARTSLVGREVAGRTLGIIGFGRIGRRVAETARLGFGMSVLYNDIVPAPHDVEVRTGARRASFREVLEASEYVTMHVPLDPSTRGMIARDALALMRPDAILVNTSRGPVVDEAAVAEALDAGRLWGYGADVFAVEPPPQGHPLIGRPDVLLTPHSAAQTEEGLTNMAAMVARDVAAVLRGTPPESPVNDPFEVEHVRRSLGLPPLYEARR